MDLLSDWRGKNSVGQFFAGIPRSFAIALNQSTELLQVYQTQPIDTSDFRYNFVLVETTGNWANVRVTLKDETGLTINSRDYTLLGLEQKQKTFSTEFAGVNITNGRLTVEVIGGTGRVLAYGAGSANGSTDPWTFEMLFRDELLAVSSPIGLTTVAHDATLSGDGTTLSPLGVANNGITSYKIAAFAVGATHLANGSVVNSRLSPPFDLEYNGASTGFNIENTGTGNGLRGVSAIGDGVGGRSGGTTKSGVYGVNSNNMGYGVFGENTSRDNRGYLGGPYAVYGESFITYAGYFTGKGIYSSAASPATAGYFNGNVTIHGNLNHSGGTENFKIDHPLDPANRYLCHAAVESSEVLNTYSGNVILDERGEAVVILPAWFEVINKDMRYNLTPIGAFTPLYIADKVVGNRFRIAGGQPGMEISWQLNAVRNDPWLQAHPFAREEDKIETERGFYLVPELYGAPPEKSIVYTQGHLPPR